jgi:hypothetical protein
MPTNLSVLKKNHYYKSKLEENNLKEFDDRPLIRRGRQDASKRFLTNLLYMIPLADTMKYIVPFYWDPGKRILDITSGKKIIWQHFPYNHLSPCGYEHWHIDFNDLEDMPDTQYHVDAREIDKLPGKWDIGVFDPPFTELKKGVESFGVRPRKEWGKKMDYEMPQKFRRDFYFRHFTPLAELFPDCFIPFNRKFDSLVIKIGDSHKNKKLIPNHVYAIKAFDMDENPQSDFNLIDCVHYRGNYARRGGRFPFAQSVTSYYLILKKNVDSR